MSSNAARSGRCFQDRRSDASGEQLLEVADDGVTVGAERLALGVLTPGRIVGQHRPERINVALVERCLKSRREGLVHDAMLPDQERVGERRSAVLACHTSTLSDVLETRVVMVCGDCRIAWEVDEPAACSDVRHTHGEYEV